MRSLVPHELGHAVLVEEEVVLVLVGGLRLFDQLQIVGISEVVGLNGAEVVLQVLEEGEISRLCTFSLDVSLAGVSLEALAHQYLVEAHRLVDFEDELEGLELLLLLVLLYGPVD